MSRSADPDRTFGLAVITVPNQMETNAALALAALYWLEQQLEDVVVADCR